MLPTRLALSTLRSISLGLFAVCTRTAAKLTIAYFTLTVNMSVDIRLPVQSVTPLYQHINGFNLDGMYVNTHEGRICQAGCLPDMLDYMGISAGRITFLHVRAVFEC